MIGMEDLIAKVLDLLKADGTCNNHMFSLTRFVFFSFVNRKHTDESQQFGSLLWDVNDCDDEKEEANDLTEGRFWVDVSIAHCD